MTLARPTSQSSARWYWPNGVACVELPKKDGSGMKKPTLADARKLGLVPSVTTVIGVLDKPELDLWKAEQACLAVLTTPRKEGETLDDFVHRVLHTEKVQDEEARAARDLGTEIHDAIEKGVTGQEYDPDLKHYVEPVLDWRMKSGKVCWTEKVLCGDGYAGRADLLIDNESLNLLVLVDYKSCKNIPKDSYLEHKLQTAAYAASLGNTDGRRVATCNVYVSTTVPGDFAVYTQDDWPDTFVHGFEPVLAFWQWANRYNSSLFCKQ